MTSGQFVIEDVPIIKKQARIRPGRWVHLGGGLCWIFATVPPSPIYDWAPHSIPTWMVCVASLLMGGLLVGNGLWGFTWGSRA